MFFAKNTAIHIILISAIVYFIVNLCENILYYSIGRHSNKEKIQLEYPTKSDFTKIFIITIFFAILQGILTWEFQ